MENIISELWKLDVKTDFYYICKNCPIQELNEFEKIKNLDTLVSCHQLIDIRKLIGFCQTSCNNRSWPILTKKFENCPTLVWTLWNSFKAHSIHCNFSNDMKCVARGTMVWNTSTWSKPSKQTTVFQ
jgi:hypothetical protein